MKKVLAMMMAAMLLVAMSISVGAAAQTFTAAKGTAVIDGVMDDAYKAASPIQVDQVLRTAEGIATATAQVYAIWDNEALYVYADVTDGTKSTQVTNPEQLYESDSFEVFVDLDRTGEDTNILETNAGQFTASPFVDAGTFGGRGKLWDETATGGKSTYVVKNTDHGYSYEYKLVWGGGYTPKDDAQIGFVLHINDDQNSDNKREGEIFANPDPSSQEKAWDTVGSYDTLVLGTAVYTAGNAASPSAPAAGDCGMALMVGAAAISFAGIVAFRRNRAK